MKIEKVTQKNTSLILQQKVIDFKSLDKLVIIIRNIKTKEEFICEHLINDNNLIIHLNSLLYLLTNYEGSIQILIQNKNKSYLYTPIVKDDMITDIKIDINKKYNLFTRVLENGEIRISSIIKK